MSHIEQQSFCKRMEKKYPSYFKNKIVLDIGSLDINGNNRFLFENSIYTGLDVDKGLNVDIVCPGHLYNALDNSFDVIISTEVFEHDMFYDKTIKNIIRMLKNGGMFLFTCASIGRVEHGTIRTGSDYAAPLLQNISTEWSNYYKNLTEKNIRKISGLNENFPDAYFEYNPTSCDLYFFGIKGGMTQHDIDIDLNLNENKIIINSNEDFDGYIEIFNWNPENNLTGIIYDKQKINISKKASFWYKPVTDFTKIIGIIVFLRDNNNNIIKEKKFKLNILDAISINYGTDKSSKIHNYSNKYQKYIPFKRSDIFTFLEIGVLNGQSLKTWNDYFYNSNLIGIDINEKCKEYENENIKIEIGSQNDINFINFIGNKYKNFNIILDDGSHMQNDVIFSFEHLFSYLKSGGIYIIEDSCTSYWPEYGGERYKKGTIIEYFKSIIDEVNFFGEQNENGEYSDRREDNLINQFKIKKYNYIGIEIESINFFNSIIIITKR